MCFVRPTTFVVQLEMTLGQRILATRTELGWKQDELGRRCKPPLHQAQISAIEKRGSKKSQHAEAICEALGITLTWAMTGNGVRWVRDVVSASGVRDSSQIDYFNTVLTVDEKELVSHYRATSKLGRAAVLANAAAMATALPKDQAPETQAPALDTAPVLGLPSPSHRLKKSGRKA